MSGTTTVPKVNFVVLNKKDEIASSTDPAAVAKAAAALKDITVKYQPKLLYKSLIDTITATKAAAKDAADAAAKAAADASIDTAAKDTAAKAAVDAAKAAADAIDAAIKNAIEVNDTDAAKVSTVANEAGSVLILIPTIDTPDTIEPLAKYVKIDNIFDSILKAEQTVILGGKKSKSKKQRKNKANKRKSVRH
jgi:hypothetical protein